VYKQKYDGIFFFHIFASPDIGLYTFSVYTWQQHKTEFISMLSQGLQYFLELSRKISLIFKNTFYFGCHIRDNESYRILVYDAVKSGKNVLDLRKKLLAPTS
jgi:hypothetical protein